MLPGAAHFARVTPVVGTALRRARVAVAGLAQAAPLAEYLAACGVGRWLWADDPAATGLAARLLAQHGQALALDAHTMSPPAFAAALRIGPPDLLLAAGTAPALLGALETTPALLIAPPRRGICRALTLLPGDDRAAARAWIARHADEGDEPGWDWRCAAPLLAGLARALLLRGTRFARDDLERLWAAGMRALTLGAGHPFDVTWSRADEPDAAGASPPGYTLAEARRGTLLVAGLGSLGSVAAALLAPHAASLLLADPDVVEEVNPVRQHYRQDDIGRPKALALRDRLVAAGARAVAHPAALTDERQVGELAEQHGVTAAIVATGTPSDFVIARALRDRGLPHVVARCYPRARYWEAIVVDGPRGPSYADLRGTASPGPAAAPTPEQLAAYSDAGALEAEPATLVESGWAAAWVARLAAQLLAPRGLRERWLLELLEAGRSCLVGGVGVEPTDDGAAYGVELPGQIHAWGPQSIAPAP